jgi:multiple sugar transport system substrate-binding protein
MGVAPNPEDGLGGRLSRRAMLQLLGAGGGALALAACGSSGGGGGGSSGSTNVSLEFQIPNSGAKLPKEDVTLRWIDSGDQKAAFFKAFFPAYTNKHSNVHVQYDGTSWNEISQVVTLGVRNGSAPDVFQLPPTITTAQAKANGWLGALDDIVPNWPEVKKRFPPGIFVPGITDFGGKTYAYPFNSNKRIANLLLYNKDYLHQAGYDPSSKVLSWDELRAAAKKTTAQGNGRYYGLIIGMAQPNVLRDLVVMLAETAGAHGGEMNWKTGQYNYASDEWIAAIDLILAMKSDGSIFPGTVSIDNPGARGRMPQGLSAMIFQGPWNIPIWQKQNPDFHLGLGMPPQHDPKNIWPMSYGPGGANTWFFYSGTKLGPVVGDIFSYMGTLQGQTIWAHLDGAGDPAAFPDAFKSAKLDPLSARAVQLADEYTRLRPDPSVKNPDVDKVLEAQKPITPTADQTLVGLFTGQIKGVKQAMQALKDRSDASLDDAIKLARQRGANITRDAWVFPDWNPREDYTSLYKKS